jgi:magnesium transporter
LYEPTIARFSFLAVFLPVVAGLGGNSGTQTLTVIVRGLALGEVSWESNKSVLLKEMVVCISNGVAIGILAGVVAYLWMGNYMLGLVLSCAMVINLFVGSLLGTLVPVFLKKIEVDPAIASGIFVTTFTDAIGFLSFLGLATYMLQHFPVL